MIPHPLFEGEIIKENDMNDKTCKTCIHFEPCMGICKLDEDFVTGNDSCKNHEEEEE